jgi:hypothetical protein
LILSVIVRDLYVVGVSSIPSEANPPLLVDPNAVLTHAIPNEALQAVPWGHSQVVQGLGRV